MRINCNEVNAGQADVRVVCAGVNLSGGCGCPLLLHLAGNPSRQAAKERYTVAVGREV